jgi:hypothetical protein
MRASAALSYSQDWSAKPLVNKTNTDRSFSATPLTLRHSRACWSNLNRRAKQTATQTSNLGLKTYVRTKIQCTESVVVFAQFSRRSEEYASNRDGMFLRQIHPHGADVLIGIGVV